jgi:hypothetical protein
VGKKRMDIFNKKKIEELEEKLEGLEGSYKRLSENSINPRCYENGSLIPENTYLRKFGEKLLAITEYLDLEFYNEYQDDPMIDKNNIPQIRILKARKRSSDCGEEKCQQE